MYAMDPKTREEIENKAEQYEVAKNRIKDRIEENVRIAIEKLMDLERGLLVEMEAELGENPFAEFLGGESHTEDDMKDILAKKIPQYFGPDEDSFKSLCKEIKSLREWRKKPKPEQLIPKNVSVKESKLDSISVSWDAVEGAKNYLIEVDDDEVFWRPGASNTLTKAGLLPGTEHTFRICTIHERVMSEWSNTMRGRTKKLPAPSNVNTKSDSWDSIIIIWDAIEGASFYQIEVDGSISYEMSTENAFTKRGLLPETEYTFRVRYVRENSVSEWSGIVKGRTIWGSVWKESPDNACLKRYYSVDEKNPRIATIIGDYYCTIIGNTPLPLNKVTSWSIKVLKTGNNGSGIYVGVAPSNIDQKGGNNSDKCGWYFDCYDSRLYSGPPHNYRWPGKEYGPRKGKWGGQYVRTGDSVGVVMDTTKGELTFVVNGMNCGVAYKGIPLDKPLVPCVLLGGYKDDSVELII